MTKEYNKHDWELAARNLLKGELARQGIEYYQLSERLTEMGIPNVSTENIRNKINRGTFSAAFLLQALLAIRSEQVDIKSLPLRKMLT